MYYINYGANLKFLLVCIISVIQYIMPYKWYNYTCFFIGLFVYVRRIHSLSSQQSPCPNLLSLDLGQLFSPLNSNQAPSSYTLSGHQKQGVKEPSRDGLSSSSHAGPEQPFTVGACSGTLRGCLHSVVTWRGCEQLEHTLKMESLEILAAKMEVSTEHE